MQNYDELPPYLHLPDLMALFGVAESTVRRWTSEARAGRSRFPLPLDMGRNGNKKGKLFWSRESIIAFQNNNQSQAPPNIESSATQRQRRHNAAMSRLQAKGVNVYPNVLEE